MEVRCWGGVNKVRHVLNTRGGSGTFLGICGYGKRGRGVNNISLYVKIQKICLLLKISLEMILLSWGIVHWKEDLGYSRFHGTSHGHGLK